jgi:hypothetical protein
MKTLVNFYGILILIFSISISACKDDELNPTSQTSGKIIDYFTKQPIEKVAVYLYNYDNSTTPATLVVYDDTLTDANGYFNFLSRRKDSYIVFHKYGYRDAGVYDAEDFNANSNEKTLELHPKMYVNVRLKNTETKLWSNVLIYAQDTLTGGLFNIFFNPDRNLDTTSKSLLVYEDYYFLSYRLTRFFPNTTDTFEIRTIPIQLIPLDTVDVEITF